MARFLIPLGVKLEVEADTLDEATEEVYRWRDFVMESLHGRLPELGISRCLIAPVREVIEGDEAWFDNERLRARFKREWEYETRQVPIYPGARITITHRIALGPKGEGPSPESEA
jgi:hypothetical protein